MSRAEELARLSEMAVNGRIVHKIDLIGMVKINGRHYFNVYRRYNSVYEIVVEDSNGDFYVQKDSMMRQSIGAVLCLSQEQLHSMYTTEIFSFRHGGTPPDGSRVPENMCWSDVQEEWYAVEIHLRGIWEDPVEEENDAENDADDADDEDDEDEDQEEDEDEDEYADMPPLISDDEEDVEEAKEDIDAVCPYACDAVIHPSMTQPLSMKRTFLAYCCCAKKESSDDEDSDAEFYSKKRTFLNYWGGVKQESSEEENPRDEQDDGDNEVADEEESVGRGCGPDDFIILRNGTKYRKVR